MIKDIATKKEFEELLNGDKPILVDFWAQWCGPCRMMAPILESIDKKWRDKIQVVKVDIEESVENYDLANYWQVQGIPNMKIFKNKSMVSEMVGGRSESMIEEELKNLNII